ncbi:DUF1830 domain-containing protein, partial [Chroococcidiopsis sp.]|uniref:DUF1830 domain-containing protein n=1 Tax=Chroococcidiopsis sp. TaxID=3088168 RepID=UPI003F384931
MIQQKTCIFGSKSISFSAENQHFSRILCSYVNETNQIQVIKITNIPKWYFERIVFPGQVLLFEAIEEAHLEVHTGEMISAVLSDKI